MEIVVVGLNHRTASVELRERMSFSKEQACEISSQILSRGLLNEILVLSTCNRTEVYGVPGGWMGSRTELLESFLTSYRKLPPDEVNGALYRHSDRDAVRHIYRVASGLDSMMLGESEILGQVRSAYANAHHVGATGRVLNRLFQSAIEVGRRVRTHTAIGVRPMSVPVAGVKLAERTLSSLKDRRALILGAGLVSEKVLGHLCDRGMRQIRVLNRSGERANILVARYGGEVAPWESLQQNLSWPDLVLASVASSGPVLTREVVEQAMATRKNRPLMLVDLGVPRNIAPDVAGLKNVSLYNIDDLKEMVLQNLKAREQEIPRAEAIVNEQIESFTRWQAGVSACSIMRDLRAGPQIDRETFLRKHLDAMSHYSDQERAYVMDLLKKFLGGAAPENGGNGHADLEMWSKVRALSAFCTHFDNELPRRG
ncbi:MAG TPA: glutamyl-tRNA reductase [Terriglobia bacterium]|nr:glutamyl-tRNA reductase [Terriglobia bacterium]